MSQFITKGTVNRLLKDVKQIILNPLTENGIYYIHDDEDMLKGYALIIGPSETPYFSGYYFFELNYPVDYPHSPPKVKYLTNGNNVRFNPNLYKCGKVCISLLNTWRGEQWTYPFIKDNFLKNYTKLVQFVENKIATTFKTPTILKTGLYDMTIEIDYLKVLNKLKECKDNL